MQHCEVTHDNRFGKENEGSVNPMILVSAKHDNDQPCNEPVERINNIPERKNLQGFSLLRHK